MIRALCVGLALLAGRPAPAQAAAPPTGAPSAAADLHIVHFNDFHGQIRPRLIVPARAAPAEERGGFPALEDLVNRRRAEHGDRLWVTNGGDWFQGTPEGNEDRGRGVLACFDRLNVTASVLGNHEYDFGEASLIELLDGAQHPILGANVLEADGATPRPYVAPFIVRTVRPRAAPDREVRIAIVGLITSDTPQVSTGPFGAARFAAEATTLRNLWPDVQTAADVVILLTHCGVREDQQLAREFPDVPLILGGHSHTLLRKPLRTGKTWMVQSGSHATAVTELGLRIDPSASPPALEIVSFAITELPATEPSSSTQEFLAAHFGHVAERWDQPLGTLRGAQDRRTGPGSTPGGSFVAALIRNAGDADVGLMNQGGLRSTLRAGPITRRAVYELLPFENSVVTFELTGAQLTEVLARSLRRGSRPLEIDGATYGYRVVDGERVLEGLAIDGAPVAAEQSYRVATNSFVAGGGDGYEMLRSATKVGETDVMLRDLLLEHLTQHGEVVLVDDERIRALHED
ncbi:MAG: bifunctional UDP-sugar hydrolase/5'-nucleotidase [Planctomycetota bacterium]